MSVTLHHGDAVAWANAYDGPLFHALLCDPPYHLTSPVSTSGSRPTDPVSEAKYNAHNRGGFMGKAWDGGDIAFRPETWAAFLPLLYPGAFGMAFAGSRGWHRMAVAIEDAGFIIHPTMFGWAYGSGFPKATRIDTQIDRDAGAEREIVSSAYASRRVNPNGGHTTGQFEHRATNTAPATPLAQMWAGHRYGLQAIKPALEPIIVFQKPYGGRPVDVITQTGAGALWIDGGRIGSNGEQPKGSGKRDSWRELEQRIDRQAWNGGNVTPDTGRWPANLLLSHAPDCAGDACAPGCAVAALGAQSGERTSGKMMPTHTTAGVNGRGVYGKDAASGFTTMETYGDTGTASRFFFNASWDLERQEVQGQPMTLRRDLTPEQHRYVMAELAKAGVV